MKESVYGVCEGMCVYGLCVCVFVFICEGKCAWCVGVYVKEGVYGVSSTLIRQGYVGVSKTIYIFDVLTLPIHTLHIGCGKVSHTLHKLMGTV